jgi:hypothetical protein
MTPRSKEVGNCRSTPQELVSYWRAHATEIESYAPHAAGAFHRAADQLEQALNRAAIEALTLEQAATESGYSADHLGRLLREKRIPNAGRAHAPRILRRDLPRKPAAKAPTGSAGDLHEGALVRSIFSSKRRGA